MRILMTALLACAVATAAPQMKREAPPEGEGKVGLYEIHALQRDWLCFAPKVPEPVHGSLVGIIYCKDGHPGDKNIHQWQIDATATGGQAKLAGTELCLDSGDGTNGINLSLGNCTDSPSQKFTFNAKTQIQLNDDKMCVDAKKDTPPTLDEWAPVIEDLQVWECMTGAPNQVFVLAEETAQE